MVVTSVIKNNRFKIIFEDRNGHNIDLDYQLHDSIVAEKWFKKIKHLKNIPIDDIESNNVNLENLYQIYNEFCKFANLDPISVKKINQPLLNQLHSIYKETHDRLSSKKDNSILYKFHHAIHHHEDHKNKLRKNYNIGWGIKEGPLSEDFLCNEYYSNSLQKNNIYLPWAELAKKPFVYWADKEPSSQGQVNELCKPHKKLCAKFKIALEDLIPEKLDPTFLEWFETFKPLWLKHHNIKKWDEIDELSAPLLAIAKHSQTLNSLKFKKIII